MSTVMVVGATRGMGLEIARKYADAGDSVVLTGRDAGRAEEAAKEIGGQSRGVALELAQPEGIAAALRDVDSVDRLVLAAIDRDANSAKEYDLAGAMHLVTMKLVGYTEVIHTLLPRMSDDAAIVIFGGLAKERPYPGSTTVSTVNGGVSGMVNALATEVAPIRVNAIHPGIVGDSPFWSERAAAVEAVKERTPIGRNVAMADIVDAVDFLLRNRSVNGIDLYVDGGWLLT
jgi:NAD(P)-dependent dehydrogenase (short-subunit alcohol dehydrogenase family)